MARAGRIGLLGWSGGAWVVIFVLGAEQVVEDVDDGGDVALGLTVLVLQGRVQRA